MYLLRGGFKKRVAKTVITSLYWRALYNPNPSFAPKVCARVRGAADSRNEINGKAILTPECITIVQ